MKNRGNKWYCESVRVHNRKELLPTGKYPGGLEKGSVICAGPNRMGGSHTFEKVLKVRGQNMIYKGAKLCKTFMWNITIIYCYILYGQKLFLCVMRTI